MSDSKEPFGLEYQSIPDSWSRRFGSRGLLQFIIGTDTESLVLLSLSGALIYVITVEHNAGPVGSLVWLLTIVVVLYFLRNVVTAIIRLVEAIRGRRDQ
jgi:hypothetical protein